jgi:hypothetical protein
MARQREVPAAGEKGGVSEHGIPLARGNVPGNRIAQSRE